MSAIARFKNKIALLLAGLWLVFTISLTVWWIVFGLRQIETISSYSHESAAEIAKYQSMLWGEGSALVLSLILGGGALIYFIAKQMKEARTQREFFAAFTHEIKTPLANIRLKSELLEEKTSDLAQKKLLTKLSEDITRVDLQLENSVFIAQQDSVFLFPEKINFEERVQHISEEFPSLKVDISQGDKILFFDKRALDTILRNIMFNAQSHGKASNIFIKIEEDGEHSVNVTFVDDGKGFDLSRNKLGRAFFRPSKTSGSGIGLFIIRKLMKLSKGKVEFPLIGNGFEITLQFPKDLWTTK